MPIRVPLPLLAGLPVPRGILHPWDPCKGSPQGRPATVRGRARQHPWQV